MVKRNFHVKAVWKPETSVWVTDSDIIGLHVEADTFQEFQALVHEFAPDLIIDNHLRHTDISAMNVRDVMPAIFVSAEGGDLPPS